MVVERRTHLDGTDFDNGHISMLIISGENDISYTYVDYNLAEAITGESRIFNRHQNLKMKEAIKSHTKG